MIHTFNNGIKLDCAGSDGDPTHYFNERYNTVNLHEPVQELMFIDTVKTGGIYCYVNIGAGLGYYAILARLLDLNLIVIAIEPEEFECELINKNTQINGFDNLKPISLLRASICNSSYDNNFDTLDEAVNSLSLSIKAIDFISMDAQGAEIEILLYSTLPKHLLIGTHKRGEIFNTHNSCLDILRNKGYKIKYQGAPGKVWLQPDGIIWAEKK